MTNSSNLPSEIRHDRIDPAVLDAIRKIDGISRKHETACFLAGATAREIMLRDVFGRPPGRRTLDVDLGIAVRGWAPASEHQTPESHQDSFECRANEPDYRVFRTK